MANVSATRYADTLEFTAISIIGHGQSCIGVGHTTLGWTINYLGASANRTADALESNTTTIANNLAALVWDLKQCGILT